MSMVTTQAGELGLALAEVIEETMSRATNGANVATYIEGDSPVSWGMLSEAGWDLVGVIEDDDSATLRDLAEIAFAWGNTLIQLPLITSLIAKRHSPAALEHEGPMTFSLHTPTLAAGEGYAPFARSEGIAVLDAVGDSGKLIELGEATADDYAPSLRGARVNFVSTLSEDAARELKVVWAAEAAGVAKRAVADAVEFTKQRQQFGKPVATFQAVKHQLANAHISAQFAETAAIWASLEPERASLAVQQSIRDSLNALQLATQTYGGLGFTWEMGVHFSLRHVTMLRDLIAGV